jgi:hypothetical protein
LVAAGLIQLALELRAEGPLSRGMFTPRLQVNGSSVAFCTTTIDRHSASRIARLAIVLEVLLGLGAVFGGGALILAPDGF